MIMWRLIFITITTIWTSVLCNTPILINVHKPTPRRIVCYYTFPSTSSDLQPQNIDYSLCTHILVGFCGLKNFTISLSKSEEQVLKQIVEKKTNTSQFKVMLSLGGGGGTFGFPEMVQNKSSIATFVQSVQRTIQRLNLDGIDLDWEFPNDIVQNEKDKFIQLLNEIRENVINSVNKYLLSVAVAAPVTLVETSYNVTEINRLVDFVNLMSYDYNFFSFWTPWTGMNAPLYAKSDDTLYFSTQNINFSSNYWIRKGMMREKINIGLPVYAHTYTLRTPRKTYLGAPAIGDGRLGGGGSAKYGTVCDFIHQQKLSPVFHEETKSPYVTNGSEWVSFENDQSMKYKADYIYENHYGGAMIFSLSSDDYEGKSLLLTHLPVADGNLPKWVCASENIARSKRASTISFKTISTWYNKGKLNEARFASMSSLKNQFQFKLTTLKLPQLLIIS